MDPAAMYQMYQQVRLGFVACAWHVQSAAKGSIEFQVCVRNFKCAGLGLVAGVAAERVRQRNAAAPAAPAGASDDEPVRRAKRLRRLWPRCLKFYIAHMCHIIYIYIYIYIYTSGTSTTAAMPYSM